MAAHGFSICAVFGLACGWIRTGRILRSWLALIPAIVVAAMWTYHLILGLRPYLWSTAGVTGQESPRLGWVDALEHGWTWPMILFCTLGVCLGLAWWSWVAKVLRINEGLRPGLALVGVGLLLVPLLAFVVAGAAGVVSLADSVPAR